MRSDIRQFIDKNECCRGVLRELAPMLPAADAELDALLEETLDAKDEHAFQLIVLSALGAKRVVQARHLSRSPALLNDSKALGYMISQMQGDVATPFLECLRDRVQTAESIGVGLYLAAVWCRNQGRPIPQELLRHARELARKKTVPHNALGLLGALAELTQDAGLISLMTKRGIQLSEAAQYGRLCCQRYQHSVLDHCRENPGPKFVVRGKTMRRAAPRIGRNHPCRCGSGKKYKHCCIDKDLQRLLHSSDVAGLTQQEVDADCERHLTKERLDQTLEPELERFDPAKIPVELRQEYVERLAAFKLHDSAAKAFEYYGRPDELKDSWVFTACTATLAGRKDIVERLLKVQPDPAAAEKELDLECRLLLAEDDPARYLELIEEAALAALQTEEPDVLQKFGYALLPSKLSAVGMFIARSMIPILPPDDAAWLFEHILETRDRLALSPDDPFGDVLDARLAEKRADDKADAEELRKAEQLLEAKANEVRRLKTLLAEAQREIARREHKRTAPPALSPQRAGPPPAPSDEAALRELRRKMETLKSALNERHHERNELRRELQKAHADLEELRQQAPPASASNQSEADDAEQDLLLPEQTVGQQPVRLIEFPRDFAGTLRRVPAHVSRATLIALGRIASGEPDAFIGSIHLKACEGVLRRRIGEYRLLYRLHAESVQVIDLIPRCELRRRVKEFIGS